jgi:PAS domain S-box-containing protein
VSNAGANRTHLTSCIAPTGAAADLWPATQETLIQLLAAAPIAIVTVNRAGTILYANAKLHELFGYAPDELTGRPIELLIPERFRRDHIAHRADYERNPRVRPMGSGLDLTARRKDGTEFPIEAGLSYITLGDDLLIMGSITDVTRRKQIEEVLERRVEERTRELERRRQVSDGLRDILNVLNSNQSLDAILHHIAEQACRLLYADASAICRTADDSDVLLVQASYGLPALEQGRKAAHSPVPLPEVTPTADQMQLSTGGRPPKPAPPTDPIDTNYQAVLTVPLVIKDGVYGSLILYFREARRFSAEEIELANSVGDQTALAIENARLRTQVERTAVAAERSRIARDLHDSVTQTLFSASIIAEVLPKLWRRNLGEAERRLDELGQLTRGALAEMRTLLLELRPATLIEVELEELLRQLTEAITGRARVPIHLDIQAKLSLPPDVKVAFYHIAQEALNNVAKHARATQAAVILTRHGDLARLTVRDNGRGFIIEKVTPEHLGLSIMHERAEAIGATLHVRSRLDQGTEVTIDWPGTPPAAS